ncbi:MAG: MTAP family purine nucleoside phosphorylase [Thermoplasmata archaeon]|nr:MAG: MTAP family purine nucleoside phosphorylase [Thermoplasmata archaeon]RLF63130.1 MAG: S-methyl-5'-thioadenosine phosphorylase [Thermoplasmata archaeon]
MRIGLIGGTGIYEFEGDGIFVSTRYGNVELTRSVHDKNEIFFLPRHGRGHDMPPHKINYRANIQALKDAGVERIIAVSTVGSMKEGISAGSMFVPDDFIDFTKRPSTFFDDEVVHVDMSQPFCPEVREAILKAARKRGKVFEGTYVSTEGPRFETKAEIAMMGKFADVVGMTLVPEVVLARERGMCYASLCIVSNMAAGLQQSLPADEIAAIYEKMKKVVMDVVIDAIELIPEEKGCKCSEAVERGRL